MIKNKFGVSEVVSTLLTLTIVLGVVAGVLYWGLPYLEEKEIRGEVETIYGGFDVMYDSIRGLVIDGYGSRATSSIVSTNDRASLNIKEESSKLVLMYTFPDSNSNNFRFNVSNLSDWDSSFKIETNNDIITDVNIYWLDPGKTTSQYAFDTQPFRKIYQDTWCAQAFRVPQDGWTLDSFKVYVSKRGSVNSDLKISIYNDSNDHSGPDTYNNSWRTITVQKEDISSDYQWIECDIADINLQANEIYHIGMNTTSGGFGNGTYNYYKWHLSANSPYNFTSIDANTTNYDIGNNAWNTQEGYDFSYRLKFTNNNPPNTPNFISTLENIESGVNKNFNVKASDNDDDKLRYKLFYGDGEYDVSPLKNNEEPYTFRHIYSNPGSYELTLQAIDINNTIYQSDNITDVYVKTGDYIPDDVYYYDLGHSINKVLDGGKYYYTIDTSRPLNGTVRIDLIYGIGNPWSRIAFGRIWIFDLGSIDFISNHDIGTQEIKYENGAILTHGPLKNNILSPPSFFEEDDAIGFRIMQLGNPIISGVSGSGIYNIGFTMKNSYSREPRVKNMEDRYAIVHNIVMQIYEKSDVAEDIWIDYYTNFYGFEELSGRPNTIYYPGSKYLVLDNSFIEVTVEGIR